MEKNMEKQNINIRVNEFVTVRMCVPSELDATEFLGICDLVKKSVSSASSSSSFISAPMKARTRKLNSWSNEEVKKLLRLWDPEKSISHNLVFVAPKFPSRSSKSITGKYYYLLSTGGFDK